MGEETDCGSFLCKDSMISCMGPAHRCEEQREANFIFFIIKREQYLWLEPKVLLPLFFVSKFIRK